MIFITLRNGYKWNNSGRSDIRKSNKTYNGDGPITTNRKIIPIIFPTNTNQKMSSILIVPNNFEIANQIRSRTVFFRGEREF